MDDTIVDFGSNRLGNNVVETASKEGFFENLEPLPLLHEVNKLASICPENIFILSACLPGSEHCKDEKIKWLKKYLPAACKENVVFTISGMNKTDFVEKKTGMCITKYDILIDDYSKNIEEWEAAGGTAIKFRNSFNTSNPEKYKYIIRDFSELFDTIEKIRGDFN